MEKATTPAEQVAASGDEVPGGEAQKPAANDQANRRLFGDPSEDPQLCVNRFKCEKYFVLRPGTLQQALKEIQVLVNPKLDGNILSIWLMAEVDHWNNEKERLSIITDNFLLVCKYDFLMFQCEQIQRIPLHLVDRICHGPFTFPASSVLHRAGEGLRVFWDRLREPSFTSWWNPFATDLPYMTFTEHPVRMIGDAFATICDMENFRLELRDAAQRAHKVQPVAGKANGVLILKQDIFIKAYVGLMSFLGNTNKLGYCVARGNLGF